MKARNTYPLKFVFFLFIILLTSCDAVKQKTDQATTDDSIATSGKDNDPKDGEVLTGGVKIIPINTPKGSFNVWTKTIGKNPQKRVLLLHGGPGCTHEYFESFESFLPKEDIEFIYYDQLGSLYADQPKDTSLWYTDRFVDEVEQVRKALNLDKSNFYLLGHSWGGILAMEYALKYQDNIKGLIISNMMASGPEYDRYAEEVLSKQMDPAILKTIKELEASGHTDDPKFMSLLKEHYYAKHICRIPLDEWPDPMKRGINHINPEVYVIMQGPSEFGLSGRLLNWDVSKRLHEIKTPTLVIGATHDTMDPKYMEWMSTQFPNGSFLLCPNGSHMAMWDDQKNYFDGLISFIKK